MREGTSPANRHTETLGLYLRCCGLNKFVRGKASMTLTVCCLALKGIEKLQQLSFQKAFLVIHI